MKHIVNNPRDVVQGESIKNGMSSNEGIFY